MFNVFNLINFDLITNPDPLSCFVFWVFSFVHVQVGKMLNVVNKERLYISNQTIQVKRYLKLQRQHFSKRNNAESSKPNIHYSSRAISN